MWRVTFQHDRCRASEVVEQIKAAGRRAITVQAASAEPAAVAAAVDRAAGEFGRLDIVVNSAGALLLGPVGQP